MGREDMISLASRKSCSLIAGHYGTKGIESFFMESNVLCSTHFTSLKTYFLSLDIEPNLA
jgi:hypothetical protein